MVISLNTLKKLEGIKVETQVVLEKLSKKIHKAYMKLLNRQRVKRLERAEFYILQQGKILAEAISIADTLDLHDRFKK